MKKIRPVAFALVVLASAVLFLGAGCGCSQNSGENANGDGNENGSTKPPVQARPRDYSRKVDATFAFPAGAAVGDWVERRYAESQGKTWVERLAVVGKESSGALWIEQADSRTVPGHEIVRRLLVQPDGKVAEGWIGYAGEKGEALELVPALPADLGEPDEVAQLRIEVPAGSFDASVETYDFDGDVVKVYRSPEVPFDGVVKREEPDSTAELSRFGKDAKATLEPGK